MWSYLDEENTSRAAEFITDWSRLSKYCGIPKKVALQWSSRNLILASQMHIDAHFKQQLV